MGHGTLQTAETVAGEECPRDECDGNLVLYDGERICQGCQIVISRKQRTQTDPWEDFWAHRKQYAGHFGEDRKRCVGGFIGSWLDEHGDLDLG